MRKLLIILLFFICAVKYGQITFNHTKKNSILIYKDTVLIGIVKPFKNIAISKDVLKYNIHIDSISIKGKFYKTILIDSEKQEYLYIIKNDILHN